MLGSHNYGLVFSYFPPVCLSVCERLSLCQDQHLRKKFRLEKRRRKEGRKLEEIPQLIINSTTVVCDVVHF